MKSIYIIFIIIILAVLGIGVWAIWPKKIFEGNPLIEPVDKNAGENTYRRSEDYGYAKDKVVLEKNLGDCVFRERSNTDSPLEFAVKSRSIAKYNCRVEFSTGTGIEQKVDVWVWIADNKQQLDDFIWTEPPVVFATSEYKQFAENVFWDPNDFDGVYASDNKLYYFSLSGADFPITALIEGITEKEKRDTAPSLYLMKEYMKVFTPSYSENLFAD